MRVKGLSMLSYDIKLGCDLEDPEAKPNLLVACLPCARQGTSALSPVSHCSTAPQPWPPPRCPSLKALVAEVVVAQVDFCHGLVDLQGVGQGLKSWHEAMAKLAGTSGIVRHGAPQLNSVSLS